MVMKMMMMMATVMVRLVRLTTVLLLAILLTSSSRIIGASEPIDEPIAIDPPSDPGESKPPNLLLIVCDQMRYDAIQFVQERMKRYDNSLKIQTPNINRLAEKSIWFRDASCFSPSCAPARGSLFTGNTMRRTGIEGNSMLKKGAVQKFGPTYVNRVNAMRTFEQELVEKRGYLAENYGKWHLPPAKAYSSPNHEGRVISFNSFDFEQMTPTFDARMNWKRTFQEASQQLLAQNNIQLPYSKGQQENTFTKQPYDPIKLDARYNKPTRTPLTEQHGFESFELGSSNICGRDSLNEEYSPTSVMGKISLNALDRLLKTYINNNMEKPFALTLNFNAPHPPMVATGKYMDKYYEMRNKLYVSPSIDDPMTNSAYASGGDSGKRRLAKNKNTKKKEIARIKRKRQKQREKDAIAKAKTYGFQRPSYIRELTAVYYGMIEEVDFWVGKLLDRLEASGMDKHTLVIFTSDHGEMLGAHGMLGKGNLYEEATRVPLLVSFPGRISMNVTCNEPVSHIDIASTIYDYLGASDLDNSDGKSLRRFIERKSYNQFFDERVVVAELEKAKRSISRNTKGIPNFMVKHGNHKLILPKQADSSTLDMMYNHKWDPYETNNLLGKTGQKAMNVTIGKAEHLKVLLLEWMRRTDLSGPKYFYSDKMFNGKEGTSLYAGVKHRRTWKLLDLWVSDFLLSFGPPSLTDEGWQRNEYFYLGRTTPGTLNIQGITIGGADANLFKVDRTTGRFKQNDYMKVRVSFHSMTPVDMQNVSAYILIKNDVTSQEQRIDIAGEKSLS